MADSVKDIYVEDYGFSLQATIRQDGVALDISDFTDFVFVFVKPNGMTVQKTAALVTDGTDGKISYTVEDGLLDLAGNWRVYGRVSAGGAESTSRPGYMLVLERPD